MSLEPLTAVLRAAAATHGLYTHACLEVSVVDSMSRWRLTITIPYTHRVRSIPLTEEVINEVEQLRAAMATPDRGTWFTARITITPDGDTEAAFDCDTRPEWLTPRDPHLEAAAFTRDLQRFPRSFEHTPDWLADLLTLAAYPPAPTRRVRPYWSAPGDEVDTAPDPSCVRLAGDDQRAAVA